MTQAFAIISGGVVANVALADPAFAAAQGWIAAPDGVGPGWLYEDGVFSPAPEPPADPAQMIETYRRAVQAHIDATAQSKGYETGFALAGYVTSTVPPWKAEAETFVAWRDQVWLFVFETLAQVETGQTDPPSSPNALIGWLPQIEWP
jgi:hypothetical protein